MVGGLTIYIYTLYDGCCFLINIKDICVFGPSRDLSKIANTKALQDHFEEPGNQQHLKTV